MKNEEAWLLEEKHQGVESESFRADCARLQNGEPLAYIIGHTPFLNCKIYLDSKPLIPRPETEDWTNKLIQKLKESDDVNSLYILDLCAGSGCIGVAIGKTFAQATIDFAELEANHIHTIEKNCWENGVAISRYQLYKSDLFANIPQTNLYTHIVANPPYIDPTLDRVEVSVKKFEPEQALYGGPHGTKLIEQIINTAPYYLKPGGSLWLEHEPEQVSAITSLANTYFQTVQTCKDQYNNARFTVCTMAQ